jgi:hypothetical protein
MSVKDTPEYRARQAEYMRRRRANWTPEERAADLDRTLRYQRSPKGREAARERQRAYRRSPEGKAVIAKRERQYRATPERKIFSRNRALREKYGIEPEDFDALLIAQSGRCAVCAVPMIDPHIDHCHTTSEVRGLLCKQCNFAAGHLADDPYRCYALGDYLKEATE